MPSPRFKLGDRVLVAAVLRRRYEFPRGPGCNERPYGKVWKRSPAKRLRGIVVGKRTLSDGVSDGSRETWLRYTETHRYSAYIVAFNLSAAHEYVLEEDLMLDAEENEPVVEILRTLVPRPWGGYIPDAKIVDEVPDAPPPF